jgi:competence/damage-inducible protein CinA-like protein
MPSAELIAIGTELLLGEIQDTNSRFLARQLRDLGVDLFRTTNIGDNAARIASAVNEALSRVDIVITTGGLGPTVDDPTRDAISLAFSTTAEFHPEIWKVIEDRFLRRGITPTENNKRQAFLPAGARVIPNPVGTAPAFSITRAGKVVFCLPGVPKEMEFLFFESVLPQIKTEYHLHGVIKVRVVRLAGIGESVVDQPIAEFERMSNPTVGLLAHPGLVDIRITAKAADEATADAMIADVENQLLALFPADFYGYDDQTLASSMVSIAEKHKLNIIIKEFGLSGKWPAELSSSTLTLIKSNETPVELKLASNENPDPSTLQFSGNFTEKDGEACLEYVVQMGALHHHDSMLYNGPQAQAPAWAINRALDIIRRTMKKHLM